MITNPDVQRAYKALQGKLDCHTKFFSYYDGEAPLPVISERLREIFRGLSIHLEQNWAEVVVNAVSDRIVLEGFAVSGNKPAQEKLKELWTSQELNLEADDAHTAALVTGEAYVFAWRDEETGELEIFYNDPRLVHVFYADRNPKRMEMAAKWWVDRDGKCHLQLYYPDRVEYYISKKKAESIAKGTNINTAFDVDDSEYENGQADNPFGRVPVFHFRLSRRKLRSDLKDVIPVQDAINMLFTNMMVASEFAALPQKYVISVAEVTGKLSNAPNTIWELPAGDGLGQPTQAGQFAAASLENFMNQIEKLAGVVGVLTRTPKHFFMGQSGVPSGEALIAMEAPLNKKASDYIARFISTWRKFAAFILELEGVAVEETDIVPTFQRPETVQPKTQAETREITVRTGIPIVTALRWEGKTEEQIEQFRNDLKEEQAGQKKMLADAAVEAAKRFDQGQAEQPAQPNQPPQPGQQQGNPPKTEQGQQNVR